MTRLRVGAGVALWLSLAVGGAAGAVACADAPEDSPGPAASDGVFTNDDIAVMDAILAQAFEEHAHNLQVEGRGTVVRVLADDEDGSRHQRFVLRLGSGQTLLIAHNIDLAPRINSLRVRDTVAFYGEYEWNEEGGTIHWTHIDPDGEHVAGWLRHRNRVYR